MKAQRSSFLHLLIFFKKISDETKPPPAKKQKRSNSTDEPKEDLAEIISSTTGAIIKIIENKGEPCSESSRAGVENAVENMSTGKEHEEKPDQINKIETDKISISITTEESATIEPIKHRPPTDEEKSAIELNPLVASTSISPSTSSSIGSSMSERSRSKSPSSERDQSFEKDLERKYLRRIHYYILDILHHIVEADRSSNANTMNNCSTDSAFVINQIPSTSTTPPPSLSTSFSSSSSTTLSPAAAAAIVSKIEEKLIEKSSN